MKDMFNFKHSFQDPTLVSDLEHLDPYRSQYSHQRYSKFLRNLIGNKLNLLKINAQRLFKNF